MPIHDSRISCGWPKDLRKYFQGLSARLRKDRARKFKFGFTVDYKRRWRETYRDDYDDMRILYQTTSHANVVMAEKIIIDYYWAWKGCVNERRGGGGPNAKESDIHYLYVVIKYK